MDEALTPFAKRLLRSRSAYFVREALTSLGFASLRARLERALVRGVQLLNQKGRPI